MMSLFHSPFHLGAQGIINGVRAMQTLQRSLTGHFKFIGAKQIKAPPYSEKFHFQCISLCRYDRLD